jgi:hypothetical protein
VAARDLHGLAIARELDFGVGVHGLENGRPVAGCRGDLRLGRSTDQVAHARINRASTRFRGRVLEVSSQEGALGAFLLY